MMRHFYRWLGKKIKEDHYDTLNKEPLAMTNQTRQIDQHGLNFNVYRASGGYVIDVRSYDQKTDRSKNSLHIVTEDMELGSEISKIIIVETLRS